MDAKTVKNLIRNFNLLSARRDRAFAEHNAVRENIKKLFSRLIATNSFKRAISRDLANGIDRRQRQDPAVGQLISQVCRYRKQEPYIAQLDKLNAKYYTYLQKRTAELSPAASSIRWVFTSAAKKEAAGRTFDEVNDIIGRIYAPETERILAGLSGLNSLTESDIYADFEADTFAYFKTIRSIIPDAGLRGGEVPEFRALADSFDRISRVSDEADIVFGRYRSDVESATEALVADKLMEILEGIPVDELNRDKAGIRINTLKDAGFNTLADIHKATANRLSYINGISMETAELCKRLTREIARKAGETIKIRLSADERSSGATSLVRAIYSYRAKKGLHDRIDALNSADIKPASKAMQNLRSAGNGAGWPFYSERSKAAIIDSYDHVRDFLGSSVPAKVRDLTEELKRGAAVSEAAAWDDFIAGPVEYINTLEDICPGVLGNDDSIYGLPEELALQIRDEVIFPNGLKCTLRRYQEWGVRYILHQGRVLLGDEMGLGKTIQAIAAMVSLKNTGASRFLVVCPASVLENWFREVAQHSMLKPIRIHGADKADAFRNWFTGGGVGITTYETTGSLEFPEGSRFDMLVVDEAHYVKNPEALRTKNVVSLSGRTARVLFMTGTALENRVDEMISLINILNPEVAKKIENIAFLSSAPQFRDAVAPVYYRRKREDVLTELPELTETQEWCVLGREEESFYEWAVLKRNFAESRRVSWNVDDVRKSVKAARMVELIEEAAEAGRKIIVFSFFLDTMRKVCSVLGDKCYGPINGSVPPARRQQIIDEFDSAPAGSVLAAQIQAGGTGLNIQSASVVIICEPQLKPSTENQAISRAYRMGQSRNVLVYRLLCKDTIDERITEILETKQQVFDAFADKSAAALENLELDETTLGDIIQAEIDRINESKGTVLFDSFPGS